MQLRIVTCLLSMHSLPDALEHHELIDPIEYVALQALLPIFPDSVEEFERKMCRTTMRTLLGDIEAWRVATELLDHGGNGGACIAIKNLWMMIDLVRGMRSDARAEDLQVVADNFARGAMLTKQGSIDDVSCPDGSSVFTQSAFHALEKWRIASSNKKQVKLVEYEVASHTDAASPNVELEENTVRLLRSQLTVPCRICQNAFLRVVPAWIAKRQGRILLPRVRRSCR